MSRNGRFTRLGPEGGNDPFVDALFERGFARLSESILEAGDEVQYVGDVNGDGYSDFLVLPNTGEEFTIIFGEEDLYSFIDRDEIEDITSVSFRLESRAANAGDVFALADFDGDGFDDFAFQGDVAGRNGIHVVSGRTTEAFLSENDGRIRDVVSSTIVAGDGGRVGSYVVDAPDADGGSALLLVTSQITSFSSHFNEYFLISDTVLADRNLLKLNEFEGGPVFSTEALSGDAESLRRGLTSITDIGDVNGDGASDLAFAFFFDDVDGVERAGRTVVSFGDRTDIGGWIAEGRLEQTSGTSFVGSVQYETTGATVTPIGDFNGDGVDDFAIGTSDSVNSNAISGPASAYILFGRNAAFPSEVDLSDLSGDDGFALRFEGNQVGRGTPWIVRKAGDFNGDDLDDVVIANRSGSYLIFGRRDDPGALFELNNLERRDGIYFNLTSTREIGDLNGDGFDDLLIGRQIYFGRGEQVSSRDDYLSGGASGDVLRAAAGNDTIEGYEGADTLYGETGDDGLAGGSAADQLFGGDGRDTLYGDNASDKLFGDAGADLLFGGRSADILYGGAGADVAYGDEGKDEIYGGAGGDSLFASVRFDFGDEGAAAKAGAQLFGGDGDDVLTGGRGGDGLNGGNDSDEIYGGVGADTLRGQKGADSLEGGEDADVVRGGGGDDYLRGEDGEDRLFGGSARDRIFGDADADEIYGGGGRDRVKGGWADDTIFGGLGADLGKGGSGDDFIYGGNGADTLRGQLGQDELYGGAGADLLVGGAGADTILGGEGDDRIRASGGDLVFGEDGTDTIRSVGGGASTLFGGDGDDFIFATGHRSVLFGDRGNDFLSAASPAGGSVDAAFAFQPGDGFDTIQGFDEFGDALAFAGGPSGRRDLDVFQDGEDAIVRYDGLTIRLLNFDEDDFRDFHFIFDLQ